MKKAVIPFLLLPLLASQAALAQVDLIAIGKVDGNYQDLSIRTASTLENGVAGNSLGGVGSGLAYAGGNSFIAIPDRGPNANVYNAAIDDTVSFINRLQTFSLSLAPNPNYDSLVVGSLPYILSPFLTDTTLLSSRAALSYGVNGAPGLNTPVRHYFTGRSDNFNVNRTSTNPYNGRLDPESVRVSNDGKNAFITDEYGPYVYQFNRYTGMRTKVFKLPDYYAISNVNSVGDTEISGNTLGRKANKGMEGLAITPDGSTLVGMMQQNLIQDTKKYVRIITIDIATNATHEYAYLLTDGSSASDIVAINNHEFLVDERDGNGLGDGSTAAVKKLYKVDLAGATEITGKAAIDNTTTTLVKTEFLNVLTTLNANGITSDNVPAKLEGVAFGPDMVINGVNKHTLFIANDNDFLPTVNGVDNPNQFFVFSVDESDLPNYVPQAIVPLNRDDHDRG